MIMLKNNYTILECEERQNALERLSGVMELCISGRILTNYVLLGAGNGARKPFWNTKQHVCVVFTVSLSVLVVGRHAPRCKL